ncbi:MAG: hypothetical protein JNJ99_02415 [Crocinitomicaceae bacterium]|nr:hypothetical protein [Crocinitomicaceae bacterium]
MKRILITAYLAFTSVLIFSCEDNADQKSGVYQCPMKCEGDKTYPDPGECPVCGMEMEEI